MFEVVLYATLAVIVCVVLFSVLGQQIGRGPDEDTKPEDIFGTTRDVEARPARPVEATPVMAAVPTSTAGLSGLELIAARDAGFDRGAFLDNATTAYSMVLEAFAEGDRDTLAVLLTPRMQELYGKAITERERQELTQVTDILRVGKAKIVEARVEGGRGEIDVAFRSELSSSLVDAVGQTAQGDPDIVASVREVWTFTRDLGAEDPAWLLSDVAPEEGDAMGVDPAPDTTD